MSVANPTLDGLQVFGLGVLCPFPAINPRREQRGNYPGLNGTESLDMGDEGAFIPVSGRLVGDTISDLQSAISTLYSFYDGKVHVLVDSMGFTWNNAKIVSIEPEGRGESNGADLGYTWKYSMRFFLLTLD